MSSASAGEYWNIAAGRQRPASRWASGTIVSVAPTRPTTPAPTASSASPAAASADLPLPADDDGRGQRERGEGGGDRAPAHRVALDAHGPQRRERAQHAQGHEHDEDGAQRAARESARPARVGGDRCRGGGERQHGEAHARPRGVAAVVDDGGAGRQRGEDGGEERRAAPRCGGAASRPGRG